MIEVLTLPNWRASTWTGPSFSTDALDALFFLDSLSASATGPAVTATHGLMECRVAEPEHYCQDCVSAGTPRDPFVRKLAHLPIIRRPTIPHVRVRRYRCGHCHRVWRQDSTGSTSASEALTSGSRVSTDDSRGSSSCHRPDRCEPRRAWHTVSTAVLDAGKQQLIDDPPASTQSAPSGSMSTHGETLARATSTTQPSSISPQSATERARPGCWTWCRTDRTSCSRHSSTRSHAPSVTLSRSAGTSSR